MESVGSYKIILIGDGGVGKTSFIQRYIDGSFTKQYIATIGANVYNLTLPISIPNTTHTYKINFIIWDTAGQEANSGLSDAYYLGAHGAIVFFDVTSRVTLKNVPTWIRKVENTKVNENDPMIPLVVVGNKADMVRDRKVDASKIRKSIPKVCEYTDLSAKSNYNFEKPLLYMVRQLLKNDLIEFATNINVEPAELHMDAEADYTSKLVEYDLKAAKGIDIPDDDEGYGSGYETRDVNL